MNEQAFLETLALIGESICQMFGQHCEVCISDLDHPEEGILYILNGHVTGRKVGDPIIAEADKRISDVEENVFFNYRKTMKTGDFIKSSTVIRRIGDRNISFCINYDCQGLEQISNALADFLTITSRQEDMDILGINEPTKLHAIIATSIEAQGKPVADFKKADRVAVVTDLAQKGILNMPHGVQVLAEALGVSRYSIYNYLKETR